jgi:dipeptidyl aminopeptidase/acylaminoacyl peptidase
MMRPEFPERQLRPNDLFALRFLHDARLSPDGSRIAYVISRTVENAGDEYFEITIEEFATGVCHDVAFAGQAMYPRWAPDGNSIAFIGTAGESARLYVADASGNHITALTADGCEANGPPAWSPDGSTIVYSVTARQAVEGVRRTTRRVFRSQGPGEADDLTIVIHLVNLQSGVCRSLDVGKAVAVRPIFSPCGQHLLFLGSDTLVSHPAAGGTKVFAFDLENHRSIEIVGDGWYVEAATWSSCGERVVIVGDYDSTLTIPMAGVWSVNRDGSNPQCRTEGFAGNLGLLFHHDMPIWDTYQNHIFPVTGAHAYAAATKQGRAEIYRIALDGPIQCESLTSGPHACVLMDVNAKTSTIVYAACDMHRPWDLYTCDLVGRNEKRLTCLNDDVLASWPQLKVEHLTFGSHDGLALEGWYVARSDREGPQPTVMFVHGGPELACGHMFRFDFHLLAANGYAVLGANFRGSSGYGEAFMRGLQGDWGGLGFPDHMAAIDAAIVRGLADPNRLGVWGPSHGGLAACWIVGHTTRFRAAVAESAITNFETLYYLTDIPDVFARDLGGRPNDIPDTYRSRSPLTFAGRCSTPTLMLHGEADLRCSMVEAEQFYRALHDAGCIAELARIPGMTHLGDSTGPLWVRAAQNEALLEWFERHL